MENNITKTYKEFGNLDELNECFKNESVFGRKLVYIETWGDWFVSCPERKGYGYEAIISSPSDDQAACNDPMKYLIPTEKYRDMVSSRFYRMCGSSSLSGCTSFLCFDDGSCLSVGLFDDDLNEKLVTEMEILKDYEYDPDFKTGFTSSRFFGNVIGRRLVDAEMIPLGENDLYPEREEKVFYKSGSFYSVEGQAKLTFDNGTSLTFLFNGWYPTIWSYTNGVQDTCDFRLVEECCEFKGEDAMLRHL